MRKILVFVVAGALANSLASSSVLGAIQLQPPPDQAQTVVEVNIVCPCKGVLQDGKIVKVHVESCQIWPVKIVNDT